MAEDKSFKYTYKAPTEEERREIEAIRREYAADNGGEDKFEQLKKLDKKVKALPQIAGLSTGVAGVLLFGGGMATVMAYHLTVWGIIVSIAGALIAVGGYFIYKKLLKRNKERYAKQILQLSDELLNADGE